MVTPLLQGVYTLAPCWALIRVSGAPPPLGPSLNGVIIPRFPVAFPAVFCLKRYFFLQFPGLLDPAPVHRPPKLLAIQRDGLEQFWGLCYFCKWHCWYQEESQIISFLPFVGEPLFLLDQTSFLSFSLPLHLSLPLSICIRDNTGVWTRSLTYARQMLYHWAIAPALSGVFL